MASLIHIGHARSEIDVAFMIVGFAVTIAGLGGAIMALWPRKPSVPRTSRPGNARRHRALRERDQELLREDAHRGRNVAEQTTEVATEAFRIE